MIQKVWTACVAVMCGLAMGCTENSPPASVAESTTQGPTKITANRPVTAATNEPVDRTNTGVNVRDRDGTAKTPFDQHENQADIQLTADIRKRIGEAKLSVNAQNVKIITQNEKVTLRGPVENEQEKQKIEEIAKAANGAKTVDNQLEVKNQ